uniref:Uncharacterized protein n=1 Tax=Globisporangium ultimum (strain ATCC 200006 / CBS 805.95 / DAOM BR144) TaxID=431595 RepID=K3X393_GLOUD
MRASYTCLTLFTPSKSVTSRFREQYAPEGAMYRHDST